jgi:signal transduction histidine kinase
MNYSLTLLFCFLLQFNLLADNKIEADLLLDSLYLSAKSQTDIESKTQTFRHIFELLMKTIDKRVLDFADELIKEAKREDYPFAIGIAHRFRGSYLMRNGNNDDALIEMTKSVEHFKITNSYSELSQSVLLRGYIFLQQNKPKAYEEAVEKALIYAKKSAAPKALAEVYRYKGVISRNNGNYSEALKNYDLSLENYLKINDRFGYAKTLFAKAKLKKKTDLKEWQRMSEESAAIAEELQELHFLQYVNRQLLQVYENNGQFEKYLRLLEKNISISESIDDKKSIQRNLIVLGDLYRNLEDFEGAENKYQAALNLSKEEENLDGKWAGEFSLGLNYLAQNEYDKAFNHFTESLKDAEQLNKNIYKMRSLQQLAEVMLSNNRPEEALTYLNRAFIALAPGNKTDSIFLEEIRGWYHLTQKNYDKTIERSLSAYQFSKENTDIFLETSSTEYLYQAYKGKGNYKEALKWLEESRKLKAAAEDQKNLRKLVTARLYTEFEQEKEAIAFQQKKEAEVLLLQTKQSRMMTIGIGFLTLLLLVFLGSSYRKNKTISLKNQQLKHLNETKDYIFSILGHDLRKPVLSFRGIAEKVNYLLKKEDYSRLNQLGHQIEGNAINLSKLTENLLAWALTQRDTMPYNPEKFPIRHVIEDTVELFEGVLQQKKLEVELNIRPDQEVYADKSTFMTITRNLLDNAIKYTPEGGKISFKDDTTPQGLRVYIEDTGVGIAPEKIKDIFLMNSNKSEVGTKGEQGTGLGLHLISELVKLNQGKINVISELGKGTRFSLLLPIEYR